MEGFIVRVLIVSVKHEHPDPMYRNFYASLECCADILYYGPGYSTLSQLEKGVSEFVENNNIDIVLITFQVYLMCPSLVNIDQVFHFHRYLMEESNVFEIMKYSEKIIYEMSKIDRNKILVFTQDYCNMSAQWETIIDCFLRQKSSFIMTWGEEFIPSVSSSNVELFGGAVVNDSFKDLLHKYQNKVISIPFEAAGLNDIDGNGNILEREYDWVVPGNLDPNSYPKRMQVLNNITDAGYRVYNRFINRTLAYVYSHNDDNFYQYESDYFKSADTYIESVYLYKKMRKDALEQWRENYRVSLRSSKIAYADGGTSLNLVSKYIIIPAHGAILFCEQIKALEVLGFRDGYNAVFASPDDVVKKTVELFENPNKMEEISFNGLQFVRRNHMSLNRAKNAIDCLRVILKGSFMGSFWDNGKYIIREQ